MITFKPIELSDKPIIDNCLKNNTFRACDFCFTNLVAWQAKFKTCFAVIDETLFLRYREDGEDFCYLLPMGKMLLREALQLIIDDAQENAIPLTIKAVTDRMRECIEKEMPDRFQYADDRDNDEYIYFSERLISLRGKKLQSKRNHINRFKADNPDWQYSTIHNVEELNECSAMLDEWEDLNLGKAEKSLRYDYIATKVMLENFQYLQLKGGLIRTGGKIVAFTIGERLTDDTFVVHVEKAFSDIQGAYTIINQQFAEHEAAAYTYVNREEDMGWEYLRKAKLSYYPDILLKERILKLKN
ncbi:MAG: phosphatidylglycerol lysyltransferase domain-containing protein [Prevotellaceae bacterium]|jgi:hypothetical protein|nr:phosphatidylglycerol lysyltransferase domain-containing protein [Prevotellaceae bacterium]